MVVTRSLWLLPCAALTAACEPLIGADFGPYELAAGGQAAAGSGAGAGGGSAGAGGMCAQQENCATAKDDDCDGTSNQECGGYLESWLVAQTPETMSQEIMSGMIARSVEASTEVLTVGSFRGDLALGPQSQGTYAGLITRVPAGGTVQVPHSVRRDGGDVFLSDVAARPANNEYVVAGAYGGSIAAGETDDFALALTGSPGLTALIAGFYEDDTLAGVISGPDSGESIATDVAVGPSAEMGVIGFTTVALPTFGVMSTPPSNSRQFYLAYFDGNFSPVWGRLIAGGGAPSTCGAGNEYQGETSLRVAIDASAGLWATGMFCGSIETSNQTLMGNRDLFVLRATADGNTVVGLSAGDDDGATFHVGRAIVATPDGGAIVAGDFEGGLAFDGVPALTQYGGRDLFVAKLSSDLSVEWARSYGGASNETARDLALGADGTIYIAGSFTGQTDFGSGLVGRADDVERVFWMRLELPDRSRSASGADPIHTHVFGDEYMTDAKNNGARRIAEAPDGRVWLAGRIEGELSFDGTPMGTIAAEYPSGFVARFEP